MRRALIFSSLSLAFAALSFRLMKLETVDEAIGVASVFAVALFLLAWAAHAIKGRKEER